MHRINRQALFLQDLYGTGRTKGHSGDIALTRIAERAAENAGTWPGRQTRDHPPTDRSPRQRPAL